MVPLTHEPKALQPDEMVNRKTQQKKIPLKINGTD